MKLLLILGIIVLVLAAVIGFGYKNVGITNTINSSPDVSPLSEVMPEESASPVGTTLLQGGSSYRDTAGLYTFLYPNDYILDTRVPMHIRIYKRGETQKGQTEIYDGVVMDFETIKLSDQKLSEWIDTHIQEITADKSVQLTSEKKEVKQSGYIGYTYTVRSLGEATYYFLQKDQSSSNVVSVSMSVNDPQQKGYQSEVDAILSTVNILK